MMKRLLLTALLMILIDGCQWGVVDLVSQRQKYIQNHPELPDEARQYILNGQVAIGMSQDEVLLCWGQPTDVHRTVGPWGTYEQWVYQRGYYYFMYLYFENGALTAWQD